MVQQQSSKLSNADLVGNANSISVGFNRNWIFLNFWERRDVEKSMTTNSTFRKNKRYFPAKKENCILLVKFPSYVNDHEAIWSLPMCGSVVNVRKEPIFTWWRKYYNNQFPNIWRRNSDSWGINQCKLEIGWSLMKERYKFR